MQEWSKVSLELDSRVQSLQQVDLRGAQTVLTVIIVLVENMARGQTMRAMQLGNLRLESSFRKAPRQSRFSMSESLSEADHSQYFSKPFWGVVT